MLTTFLTASLLLSARTPSSAPQGSVGRADLDLKSVTLTPQLRLEAARRAFGTREQVSSLGT
ncbi:hypothetical protein EON79_19005, partial [bacterium]